MGRRRTRTEAGPRVSGYIPSASPTRPPTSAVYLIADDGRLYIENFTQDEYAAAFLQAALAGEGEHKWLKDNVGRLSLLCGSGLRIRASAPEELERIMEYEDDVPELPEMLTRTLAAFKAGHGVRRQDSEGNEVEPPAPKPKREKREKTEKAPKKEKPAGYKGVPELCADLNREGSEIRVVLRKHVTKPDIGWLWDNDNYLKVRAVVKKELG